jgi:hypothetical protein
MPRTNNKKIKSQLDMINSLITTTPQEQDLLNMLVKLQK